MQSILLSALTPYTTQGNTGNIYEINVILQVLRGMGLTNADLDSSNELIERIIQQNSKIQPKLYEMITTIRTMSVGNGFVLDGHRIVGIQCATQDDSVGTGDIVLTTSNGTSITLSICQGTVKKKTNTVEKCLTNPSCIRFGCTEDDIQQFKCIEKDAVIAFKDFMSSKYGSDEIKWPSRIRTTIAVVSCSQVAKLVESRFSSLSEDTRKTICTSILQIKDNKPPADYLAVVDKKTNVIQYFKFDHTPTLTDWKPRLIAEGIYIKFYNGDRLLGKTQVKFNNGIYHKGKTSSISDSWNASFNLTDVFQLKPIQVSTIQTVTQESTIRIRLVRPPPINPTIDAPHT